MKMIINGIISFLCSVWPHQEALIIVKSALIVALIIGSHDVVTALHTASVDVLLIELIEQLRNILLAWLLFIKEMKAY